MSNRRVSFSPDVNDQPPLFAKHQHSGSGGGMKVRGNNKKVVITGVWAYRSSENSGFSPVRLLKRVGAKVAIALQFVSQNRKSSRKVSSSSSSSTLARSRSYAETVLDSHRAEAIEDCIEFLNSSSCLSRSSSVTAFSC